MDVPSIISAFLRRIAYISYRWRYRAGLRWFSGDRGDFIFGVILVLMFGFVGLLGYIAFSENRGYAAERQRMTDLGCLARNIYYEARGEPIDGQQAVAEVTLNRVESGRFPNAVCAVVYEKNWDRKRRRYVGAFSWTEFDQVSRPRGPSWDLALDIAKRVYDAEHEALIGGALFYHATSIEPAWASSKKSTAKIGRHIFYN